MGALGLLLALALAGCASQGAGSQTIKRVPTPTWRSAAGAPGVTPAVTAGWSQYRDPTYGFVAQFPSGATINVAPAQSATTAVSFGITNPQDSADRATLEVTATTQASAGICAQYASGKPVTLAGGVTGYQHDNLSDAASSSAGAQPQVAVIFTHSGLLTIVTLTGQAPATTFMQRWGSVWEHILATFQPGQGPAGAQPCG